MAKDFTFISGNEKKAVQLKLWLGLPVRHQKLDIEEIQSLDLQAVAAHKARQAYAQLKKPVLVEDVGVTFDALGALPGPYIKWFLEELGGEGLTNLVARLDSQKATVSICYAWYNGTDMRFFEHSVRGSIPPEPRGSTDFGWNADFIPEGSDKTYGEMTDDEKQPFSMRAQAIDKLRAFLEADD